MEEQWLHPNTTFSGSCHQVLKQINFWNCYGCPNLELLWYKPVLDSGWWLMGNQDDQQVATGPHNSCTGFHSVARFFQAQNGVNMAETGTSGNQVKGTNSENDQGADVAQGITNSATQSQPVQDHSVLRCREDRLSLLRKGCCFWRKYLMQNTRKNIL
ncbi:unnamed protein product [Fraxinus pennsylvanica]|uniref:Uncharacterized protein n=1 Tax=Fraxinus pennsylvanica TaxID=56036 RepID=A0AAD2E760_9LAMI|nr:unnamed protein product [Fraxinus pennsylvanica]